MAQGRFISYLRAMPFPTMPDPAADLAHEQARRYPERETLELAAAGAARVLGVDHGVTKALARAAITMATVDLWRARPLPRRRRGEASHSGPPPRPSAARLCVSRGARVG